MMEERNLGILRRGEIIGGIAYLPMYLLGSQFLAVLVVYAMGMDLESEASAAAVNLAFGLINLLALGLIFRRYLRDQYRVLLTRGWRLFADTGFGLVQYLCLTALAGWVAMTLASVLGVDYSNANQEAVEQTLQSSLWMSLLVICVLAPPVEELLCRGLIFCGLYRRGRVLAYGISMLFFSALHVYAPALSQPIGVSLVSLIIYLPAGYALARAYERNGTIWTSIFLHILINLIALLTSPLAG